MTYSHMANATLPSAHYGFTSEFGKGSGGSHVLWSPDKLVELLLAFANRFYAVLSSYKTESIV
jgi:hypothetical protein